MGAVLGERTTEALEGALLLAALGKVRDELGCSAEHNSGECSAEHKGSPRVSYADALVAMAETARRRPPLRPLARRRADPPHAVARLPITWLR